MNNRIYNIALFLALLSGCAALGHQLLWTRRLIDILGGSAESSARVFGCFFLGLGLGSAFANYLIKKNLRPWKLLGILELAIVIFCLPIFFLPELSDWIWPVLGTDAFNGWQSGTCKLIISFAAIVPPAFLMGIGLPVMASALLHGSLELSRHGIWLYAINTLGGVLGLILVSGFLLHWFGASGAMIFIMGINLIIAVSFFQIDRAWNPENIENKDADPEPSQIDYKIFYIALAISFISGAGILALEVISLQMYMLVATMSIYGPTAVLITVIFLLAISALCLPILTKYFGNIEKIFPHIFYLAGLTIAIAPLIFMLVVSMWNPARDNISVLHFVIKFVIVVFITLGPALFISGLIFPMTVSWLGKEGGDRHGSKLGWLLAVNGLGGLVGAEVAYRFILPSTGIHYGVGIIALCYAVLALPFFLLKGLSQYKKSQYVTVAFIVFIAIFVEKINKKLPHVSPGIPLEVIEEKYGREGSLAIVRQKDDGVGLLMSNQYMLGSTSVRYSQERQAHIPIILHPDPKKVGFIGHATGITPGAALRHENIESVVSVDIASIVIDAAKKYYGEYNYDIANNSRAQIIAEDGRTYFASANNEFDVIEADLFLPWGSGVGRLYSLEHFKSIKNALKPNGVFCQWLAMYQLSKVQFDVIAHTLKQVFPNVYIFINGYYQNTPQIGLVVFKDSELNWDTVKKRCLEIRVNTDIRDPIIRHHEGMGMLYFGEFQSSDDNLPINKLGNMWMELNGGYERLVGDLNLKYFIGSRWIKFLEAQLENYKLASNENYQYQLSHIGFNLAQWDYANKIKHNDLKRFTKIVNQSMPRSIVTDVESDWSLYPGKESPIK